MYFAVESNNISISASESSITSVPESCGSLDLISNKDEGFKLVFTPDSIVPLPTNSLKFSISCLEPNI